MSPIGRFVLKNAVVDKSGALALPFFTMPNVEASTFGVCRLHNAIAAYLEKLNRMSR
jgi:hypothetical protein